MTAQEILNYINKNISYEFKRDNWIWSQWHDFKEESLPQMLEIQQMKGLGFKLEIKGKKFRIWYCLL